MSAEIPIKLVTHLLIAIIISGLISGSLSTVFKRLEAGGKPVSGNGKLAVTLIVSMIISFGYTMYYSGLPISESVAIFVMVAFGPQALYEVISIKKGDE